MDNLEKYIEDPLFIRWVFQPNPEIEAHFIKFQAEHPDEREDLLKLRRDLLLLSFPPEMISEERNASIFRSTLVKILKSRTRKRVITLPVSVLKYAAVLVLIISVAGVLIYQKSPKPVDLKITEDLFLKNANQNTTLFMPDGTRCPISGHDVDIDLATNGSFKVNGTIVGQINSTAENKTELLVVPFGKKAKISLSDGSHIWLNAGSRLVFPNQFVGKKREVYLVGEGYFEVAHNERMPFLVKTSTVTIQVLGTSFNVSSYPDDDFVSTVLKEGKISMKENEPGLFGSAVQLVPNQIAIVKKDKKGIQVTQTNCELHTLWKDGVLRFENADINSLIIKVERFYNISLELKNPLVGKERITGKLDLNAGMPEVFEYISKVSHGQIKKINPVEYILE